MLDTTKLNLSREQAGNSLKNYLTNLTEIYKHDSKQTFITGNAGNLRVSISESQVSITGSLPKFYLGNNIQALTREDCKRAFEKLADTLHLPIHEAKVIRLDIGHNITTDYTPELYYKHLGNIHGYERSTLSGSLYYKNSLRTIRAYDKIAESKKNKAMVPDGFQGLNLLRFEVSFMQRLPKQFNQAFLTPDILTTEEFYRSMYDRWYKEYERIQKIGIAKMDTSKMKTPNDFLQQLQGINIQEKGLEQVLHYVDVLKEKKVFKHQAYYSNLKKEIRRLLSIDEIGEPELVQELNIKMAKLKESYL